MTWWSATRRAGGWTWPTSHTQGSESRPADRSAPSSRGRERAVPAERRSPLPPIASTAPPLAFSAARAAAANQRPQWKEPPSGGRSGRSGDTAAPTRARRSLSSPARRRWPVAATAAWDPKVASAAASDGSTTRTSGAGRSRALSVASASVGGQLARRPGKRREERPFHLTIHRTPGLAASPGGCRIIFGRSQGR